ncbi:U1 small nuclear ribonucleoprotein 70 kDa-like [Pseudomyrmex gracilis]|uniref:U1 small nuclear ribonucleoprotein 70 kDa-like n=1 Tax=Pseudomyrmex gracilis TaxID=219809 RepID=UPI0009951CD2|nr:U1 small nuclear ribonucleoprotein 70 kDa-like [Pseudomyrmex gracilis]
MDEDTVPSTSRSRTEEKLERRKEWRRQQELEQEHERLRRQKIEEWERKQAQELGKRSPSDSPPPRHTGRSGRSPDQYLSTFKENLNKLSGPWFNGPKDQPINRKELRRIKVDIRRNIPVKGPIPEIKRDILNPDDVVISRRNGEGCKPIFDKIEIKQGAIKDDEKKKHRTIITTRKIQLDSETNKMRTSRKRSLSPNSSNRRNRSKQYKVCEKNYTDIDEEDTDIDERRTKRSRSKELKRNSHCRCGGCEKSYKHSRKSKDTERNRDRYRNKNRDQDTDEDEDRDSDKYITWKDIKNCNKLLKLSSANSFHPYNFPPPIPIIGPMFPPRGFRPIACVRRYPYPYPVGPIGPRCPNPTRYRYDAPNRM